MNSILNSIGRKIFLILLIAVSLAASANAEDAPLTVLTAEEHAWLDQNPDKLTLVFNTARPPIEFPSATGEFTGMAADIVARIEKRLNVVFVKRPSATWEEALYALKNGDVSLMPAIVKTEEREGFAFFTTPYTVLPLVIIGKRDMGTGITLDDLAGRRVSIVSGIAVEEYLRRRPGSRIQIVPMPHAVQGLQAASLGRVDAFVENLGSAAYYIEKESIDNLQVIGTTEYIYELSLGVGRKYPLLFSSVQKALADVPPAELETIRKHWISLKVQTGMSAETRRLTALIAVFTALLLMGLGLISYALKRRLNEKMARLKSAQEIITQSEIRFRTIFENAPIPLTEYTRDGKIIAINECFRRTLGYTPEDLPDLDHWWALAYPDPDYRSRTVSTWQAGIRQAIATHSIARPAEYHVTCKNGTVLTMLITANVIGHSILVSFSDITEQRAAEKEREKLQGQLLQSQKLEAVGILAGGVAHDFNNMLGAIIGYAELTMRDMDEGNPFRKNLGKILDAARRSADITRQLLAFARKQTISPVVFNLNQSIEAILKMIRRLIGENIELAWLPGIGRFMVKMDPSQLDQIIVNLCVNARDAIAGIGRITIETDTLSFDEEYCRTHSGFNPGEYVRLSVSDNGCGMDKETLMHIFEPFFTTKGLGQGTGMGLATIYGIVQQNEGFITVYSEAGMGTIFKVHIPMNTTEALGEKTEKSEIIPPNKGETILIVEDDPMLLEMTAMMLQDLGYSVLSAATPGDAIGLVRENRTEIHLFITDVVMPEMNGRELAERILEIRPTIKHLFMSGYTADVIAHQGVLDEGINFIQKPFMLQDLSVKVHEILG